MAGTNGAVEKRLAVLERLSKKNEERWAAFARYLKADEARQRKQDERIEAADRRFEATDRRFEATDRRFEEADRRFDAMLRVVTKQNENIERQNKRLDKLEQSVDASLKILYRLLEKTGPGERGS